MKYIKKIIYIVVLIYICILSVNAKEKIATCTYKGYNSIASGKVSLEYTLYNDETIEKKDTGDLTYNSSFEKEWKNALYNGKKLSASCPKIYICNDYSMRMTGDVHTKQLSCDGNNLQTLSGTLKSYGNVNVEKDKSQTYCSATYTPSNVKYEVEVKFFLDSKGNRKFSVYQKGTNNGGEAGVNEIVWVGQHSFRIDKDDIEDYYKSEKSCQNSKKYFNLFGSQNDITITSQKPDKANRGGVQKLTPGSNTEDLKIKFGNFEKEIDCNNIFNGQFGKMLKYILSIIHFAVPILILGLSVLDYIKAIAAQDQNEIKKVTTKFGKRLIIGVLIFLLPTLLDVLLSLAGIKFGVCTLGT